MIVQLPGFPGNPWHSLLFGDSQLIQLYAGSVVL